MTPDIAATFHSDCVRSFAFLREFGFGPGQLVQVWAPEHVAEVAFLGNALAIECVLDDRERVCELKVARLRNGLLPAEYAVTADGTRVRVELTNLLVELGVRSFGLRPMGPEVELRQYWQQRIAEYARILREHGQRILADDPTVLN